MVSQNKLHKWLKNSLVSKMKYSLFELIERISQNTKKIQTNNNVANNLFPKLILKTPSETTNTLLSIKYLRRVAKKFKLENIEIF